MGLNQSQNPNSGKGAWVTLCGFGVPLWAWGPSLLTPGLLRGYLSGVGGTGDSCCHPRGHPGWKSPLRASGATMPSTATVPKCHSSPKCPQGWAPLPWQLSPQPSGEGIAFPQECGLPGQHHPQTFPPAHHINPFNGELHRSGVTKGATIASLPSPPVPATHSIH